MPKSIEILKEENQKLRNRLNDLLHNARDNEKKLRRFEYIEFKLLQAESIHALFDIILLEYPKLFKLTFAQLVLADCELNIQPIFDQSKSCQQYTQQVKLLHLPKQLDKLERLSNSIYLGPYDEQKYAWLMSSKTQLKQRPIRSVAIIPLIRHEKTIGVFCCASDLGDRFEPEFGNDFMQRLGFIIGVCIENVIISEKLKQHSLTDPLTKVRNRRFFDHYLLEEITRVKRSQLSLSCILIDIDHFKKVNDEHGHRAGDQVLIQVVNRIVQTLRNHEVLVRYGGEEFALLLPETENGEAIMVAERICFSVNEKPIPCDSSRSLDITVSAGVATYSVKPGSITFHADTQSDKKLSEDLVHKADLALYKAKETGRNRVCNSGYL